MNIGTPFLGRQSSRRDTDALPFCNLTLKAKRPLHGPYFTKTWGYPANPKTIGEAVRKRRLDLNLKQREAAKQIGCNYLTVVNWEKGHSTPRVNHMAGVVRFLGYNPFPAGATMAERLVTHRKARGITQKQFARELGVDPTTLARWERGERLPKGRFVQCVSVALSDSSVRDSFGGK